MRFSWVAGCMGLIIFLPFAPLSAKETDGRLKGWLATHANYRLATPADCECTDALKSKSNYDPYRIQGDFDGDGTIDEAGVVVSQTSANDYFILVFASRFVSGKAPVIYRNFFEGPLIGLALFKNEVNKNRPILLFGPFSSEAEPIHLPISIPGIATQE